MESFEEAEAVIREHFEGKQMLNLFLFNKQGDQLQYTERVSPYRSFRKRQTWQECWTNDTNRRFIQIANKHVKLCAIAMMIREISTY